MFLPMEVVVSPVEIDTVHLGSLTEIPSLGLVTRAISMLCKKKESTSSDSYVYMKFPFGTLDYRGLKDLQNYHQYLEDKKSEKEIQAWLLECESIRGVNMIKIKENLSRKPLLTHLTGKHWVSDDEISALFQLLNKRFNDVICLVCTPDCYVENETIVKSQVFTGGKVLVALNVKQDSTTKSTTIADGIQKGNHWALLALNTQTRCGYYGDSLGWDIPSNLETMVKPILEKVGINLEAHKIVSINGCNSTSEQFYPRQTCSNMCGVILLCMAGVMCCAWDKWLTWNCDNAPQYLLRPSYYCNILRLNVISWIVEDKVNLYNITIDQGTPVKEDCIIESDMDCIIESDMESDNLEGTDKNSDSDHFGETFCSMKRRIISMLPSKYEYKIHEIDSNEPDANNFTCTFSIKLENEENAKQWVKEYNDITKQTMVFERNKKQAGKRVLRKLYMRCQHKQRQTGQHTKSDRSLKTTHKEHDNKHTNCPAQMKLTILAPLKQNQGFLVEVELKHTHNHLISVADALRFRPISEETKGKYYDLFNQGHSPASSHLEYETNVMYSDNPQLIADRSINPKLSDVYNLFNKWRKNNLGVRTDLQNWRSEFIFIMMKTNIWEAMLVCRGSAKWKRRGLINL